MSKTLSNILTVFKVARILAKVIFILSIVGGAGCLIGLCFLPLADGLNFLSGEVFIDLSSYLGCSVGIISCTAEAVFAFMAEKYFKKVLDAGTPFTFESSKESFRLGIASLIISVATSIVAGIVAGIILLFSDNFADYDTSTSFSLATGLFFLFLSMIFKYGAELNSVSSKASDNSKASQEETEESEML